MKKKVSFRFAFSLHRSVDRGNWLGSLSRTAVREETEIYSKVFLPLDSKASTSRARWTEIHGGQLQH